MNPFLFLIGRVLGHMKLIVIGDHFVESSADQHFKKRDEKYSYAVRHFDIDIASTSANTSNNPEIMSRLRNNLVVALNRTVVMPKIIMIVLEDDIIKTIDHKDHSLGKHYERRIKWLMSQYRRIIESFLEKLPLKCKREGWPKFLWVSPTLHKNYKNNVERKKFTQTLESNALITEKTTALRVRNGWDFEDNNLFLNDQQRFTVEGLASIWSAVDQVLEFYDLSKFDLVDAPLNQSTRNDYSWQSIEYQNQHFDRRNNNHNNSRQGVRRNNDSWRKFRF